MASPKPPTEVTSLLPPPSEPPIDVASSPPNWIDPLSLTSNNRAGILAGIWTATFLASINTTLVATLLTSISSEFDSANEASWLGTSYLLATATFTPLYGRLSNVLGRRGANQLAVFRKSSQPARIFPLAHSPVADAVLFLGTLGCGTATSMRWLIISRFVAGCGGGGIFTTASIITSDLYDMRSRSLTQGIASIFSGVSSVNFFLSNRGNAYNLLQWKLGMGIGGPLGGWISDRYGWRTSFLIQLPIFFASFYLTQRNLLYSTPSKSRSTFEILSRIDYLGSLSLFTLLISSLIGLSLRYNQDVPWSDSRVVWCLVGIVGGALGFGVVEGWVAKEPVLPGWLMRKRVPLLVGVSSLLVPMCNFAVMYFFPALFELVLAKTSTEAGAHLMPNSVSMSLGSLFAGYVTALLRNSEGMTHIIDASFVMHRTGKYKTLNVVFGILPFLATLLIIRLSPESGFFTQWLSIIPLGFGNAVVLQTTLIALLVSIDHSHMAVGTGFVQLFRGVGQVAGVAIPSAMFQSILRTELQTRITGPGSAELISKIRHNSRVVNTLPTEIQATVREAFRIGLRSVFIFAAICTFLAFVVRLGIPEQSLDKDPSHSDSDGEPMTDNSEDEAEDSDRDSIRTIAAPDLLPPPPPPPISPSPSPRRIPVRRLSTYMSDDGMDPEVGVPQSWKSSVGRRAGSRQSSLVVGSWVSGAAGRSGVVLEEGDGVEHTAV